MSPIWKELRCTLSAEALGSNGARAAPIIEIAKLWGVWRRIERSLGVVVAPDDGNVKATNTQHSNRPDGQGGTVGEHFLDDVEVEAA